MALQKCTDSVCQNLNLYLIRQDWTEWSPFRVEDGKSTHRSFVTASGSAII